MRISILAPGKRFRRKAWANDSTGGSTPKYVEVDKDEKVRQYFVNKSGETVCFNAYLVTAEDVLADDWEEV